MRMRVPVFRGVREDKLGYVYRPHKEILSTRTFAQPRETYYHKSNSSQIRFWMFRVYALLRHLNFKRCR